MAASKAGAARSAMRRLAVLDRRYPGEPPFPKLAMVGMVETRVERAAKILQERRLDLSSARLDAETFANAVRLIARLRSR